MFQDTKACIVWMYERMEYGCKQYPGFFSLHSLGFMQDARIRADAFTEQFTAERFADVLFSLMLSALLRQDYDSTAILEIVSRTLY